jgi:hypothetical protein
VARTGEATVSLGGGTGMADVGMVGRDGGQGVVQGRVMLYERRGDQQWTDVTFHVGGAQRHELLESGGLLGADVGAALVSAIDGALCVHGAWAVDDGERNVHLVRVLVRGSAREAALAQIDV